MSVAAIQRENPTARPTALRLGQSIHVPAINPPAADSQPANAGDTQIVQSTATAPIPVRWSPGGNKVGDIERGRSVFAFAGGGVDVPIGSIQNQAAGIVAEMAARHLIAGGMMLFGHIDPANMRPYGAAIPAADVDLIARMIWGEQRSEGNDAMAAAAWIARNRFDAGWGSYGQIITPGQFHGLATPADVTGLTGPNLTAWTEAQRIAQEVVGRTLADPTGGALYFGNDIAGANVLTRMRACDRTNPDFSFGRIGTTNFLYCNGDYTSAACTVP